RLVLHGHDKDDTAEARRLFQADTPNALWAYFPEPSILTVTGQIDLGPGSGWEDFLAKGVHRTMIEQMQRTVGTLLGLNLERDVFPNLGPDWGLCVFPSGNAKHMLQSVF